MVDAVRIFRFVCCRSSIRKFLLRDPPKELVEGGGRKLKFFFSFDHPSVSEICQVCGSHIIGLKKKKKKKNEK